MNTFRIITLGCKVNQSESEVLAAALLSSGWTLAAADGPAEVCIVNTCTVTGRAAMQCRQALRRCRRENPDALIIATGCYASVGGEELQQTGAVDWIVPHRAKYRIPRMLAETFIDRTAWPAVIAPDSADSVFSPRPDGDFPVLSASGRLFFKTRAFLKIQDGCNSFCTYCIVPYTRGRSVSMPPDTVLSVLRSLAASGYREIVLSGIHLGAYGLDLSPPIALRNLLARIAAGQPADRIRLSSIEPAELTPEIIQLAADSEIFCPHFHVPLQSGADTLLQKMGRPYSASFFGDLVHRIRAKVPGAAIGADVLVGFPGEGEKEFAATCDLIRNTPVTYLHVFPFSPRPQTPARTYDRQVTPAIIKERCRLLREIGREKNQAFYAENAGETSEVLVETRRDEISGKLKGLTPNYATVFFSGPDSLMSRLVRVRIGAPRKEGGAHGTMVEG